MISPLATYLYRKLLKDETGGITVESVLWVPIYGAFFALIADVSLALNSKSQAQRIIQDVNRLASSGYMAEASDVEARAGASLAHISTNADVVTTIENNIVTTIATIPGSDVMALGILSAFTDLEITVAAFHVVES